MDFDARLKCEIAVLSPLKTLARRTGNLFKKRAKRLP